MRVCFRLIIATLHLGDFVEARHCCQCSKGLAAGEGVDCKSTDVPETQPDPTHYEFVAKGTASCERRGCKRCEGCVCDGRFLFSIPAVTVAVAVAMAVALAVGKVALALLIALL